MNTHVCGWSTLDCLVQGFYHLFDPDLQQSTHCFLLRGRLPLLSTRLADNLPAKNITAVWPVSDYATFVWGTSVWTTCLRLCNSTWLGIKPAISWSLVWRWTCSNTVTSNLLLLRNNAYIVHHRVLKSQAHWVIHHIYHS